MRLEAAQATATEIAKAYNVKTLAVACNVAVYEEVEAAVEKCVAELGSLDCALNAAGQPSPGGKFSEYPVKEFVSCSTIISPTNADRILYRNKWLSEDQLLL